MERETQIEFYIEPELNGVVPEPKPATRWVPDWYKQLPMEMTGGMERMGLRQSTVRACIPFIEGMTTGYILTTAGDVTVNVDGSDIETHSDFTRGVLNPFKDGVTGDMFPHDGPIAQFKGYWRVDVPDGVSMLFLPVLNRPEKTERFRAFSGVIDVDNFDGNLNTPIAWLAGDGEFFIPQDTPIAQCIPFYRDSLLNNAVIREQNEEEKLAAARQSNKVDAQQRVYRDEQWQGLPSFTTENDETFKG